jgi:regulatory protein
MDFDEIKLQVLRAYTRALKLLSYRPRSEKEIRDRLIRKEFDPLIIDQVIDKLKEDKFLNDKEFAQWLTESRQNYKGRSKYVIRNELSEKGVDKETITKTLSNAKDDLETAKELFERRRRIFERYSGEEYTKKVTGFLQRKGYSWDIIQMILKNEE